MGDGLYLIGLNVHVGFVVVEGQTARLVHASYTGKQVVTDEPVAKAEAIELSRKAGYFVTPVLADDGLIKAWLGGDLVQAPS